MPSHFANAHVQSHIATNDRVLEPVGPGFFAYARRKRHNRTFSEDERHEAEEKAKHIVEEETVDFEYEEVDPTTVNTDPTNWKVKKKKPNMLNKILIHIYYNIATRQLCSVGFD